MNINECDLFDISLVLLYIFSRMILKRPYWARITGSGLLWFVLLYADLKTHQHFFSLGIVLMMVSILLLLLVCCSMLFIFLPQTRRFGKKCLIRTFIPFLFLSIEFTASQIIWGQWENATINEGNRIVAALDQFNADNGKYPDTLQELIPNYLDIIPRTQFRYWVNEFEYSRREDEFLLGFGAGGLIYCRFNEEWTGRKWFCDD